MHRPQGMAIRQERDKATNLNNGLHHVVPCQHLPDRRAPSADAVSASGPAPGSRLAKSALSAFSCSPAREQQQTLPELMHTEAQRGNQRVRQRSCCHGRYGCGDPLTASLTW